MGFYPHISATDEQAFIAGLALLLTRYPPWFQELAAHPVSGLPGAFKFVPSLAEAREWCEARFPAEERYRERAAMPRRLAGPTSPSGRPLDGPATYSGLCAKYGIRGIPGGWDAVDVVRHAAQLGAGCPAYVDRLLGEQEGKPQSPGLFGAIVAKAKAARPAPSDDDLRRHYQTNDADEF